MRRRLLRRPLLIGRVRDTAALLLTLTQDARRPRLGMVPDAAADRHRGRRRRRSSSSSSSSRVFEIVEQVVELAVPFGVAERRRPRLKRRHRPPSVRCPRCLQRGRECAPTDVLLSVRALRFLGPRIGEYLALTHPLTRSPHTLHARSAPSSPLLPHITGSLRLSLPPRRTVRQATLT